MLLTCSLISSFQSILICFRPMTSHHVICHVTTVTCLFIVQKEKEIQKKRNINSEKIDKRKRKILVSKYIITICLFTNQFTCNQDKILQALFFFRSSQAMKQSESLFREESSIDIFFIANQLKFKKLFYIHFFSINTITKVTNKFKETTYY